MEAEDCIVCCELVKYHAVMDCNHGPLCHLCALKIDKQNKDICCPICKASSERLFFTARLTPYQTVDWKRAVSTNFRSYFYFQSSRVKDEIIAFEEYRCPVPGCREAAHLFDNLNRLLKHLAEAHRRHYCDVCLDFSTLTLREMKLYSDAELHEHLHCGEFLENGLELYHPYCRFCRRNFYDQEQITQHLKGDHYKCDFCPDQCKTLYYSNYRSLERHFELTHYLCPDAICREERYKVFVTRDELQEHQQIVHLGGGRGKSKALSVALLGFNKVHEDFKLNDKEGVDFREQLISMRNNIYERLDAHIDHQDEKIDFRDSFKSALKTVKWSNIQLISKIKVVCLQEELTTPKLQQIDIFIPLAMTPLKSNDLYRILKQCFGADKQTKIQELLKKFPSLENIPKFSRLFERKFDNQKSYLYSFPILIRAWPNERQRLELDKFYLEQLKNLPRSKPITYIKHESHGEFINQLFGNIENVLRGKIEIKDLSLKDYFQKVRDNYGKSFGDDEFGVQRQKIMQISHIISHLPTKEMTKFKWLFKLGISIFEWTELLKQDYMPALFMEFCKKLPMKHLAILYIYIRKCKLALFQKIQFVTEKDQKNSNFLADFLSRNKNLLKIQKIPQKYLTIGRQIIGLNKKQIFIENKLDDEHFPSFQEINVVSGKPQIKQPDKETVIPKGVQERKPPDRMTKANKKAPFDSEEFPQLEGAEYVPLSKQQQPIQELFIAKTKKKKKQNFIKIQAPAIINDYEFNKPTETKRKSPGNSGQKQSPIFNNEQFPQFQAPKEQKKKAQKIMQLEPQTQPRNEMNDIDPSLIIQKKKPLDYEVQFGLKKDKKKKKNFKLG